MNSLEEWQIAQEALKLDVPPTRSSTKSERSLSLIVVQNLAIGPARVGSEQGSLSPAAMAACLL